MRLSRAGARWSAVRSTKSIQRLRAEAAALILFPLALLLSLGYPDAPCLTLAASRCRCLLPPKTSGVAHLGAASAPGYHPRPATNDLKEIVEDSMEEILRVWDQRFRDTHGPIHPRVKDLLEAFVRCGDLHFGFVRVRCVTPGCPKKDENAVPFSCKARNLCPSCGQRRAIGWAERMVGLVLRLVPYRQLVFTPSRSPSGRHSCWIIAAIGPDQPDVIERILRHLNRWDPPCSSESWEWRKSTHSR